MSAGMLAYGACRWRFEGGVWTKINDCGTDHQCPPESGTLHVPVGSTVTHAVFLGAIRTMRANPSSARNLSPLLASLPEDPAGIARNTIADVACIRIPTTDPTPGRTDGGD